MPSSNISVSSKPTSVHIIEISTNTYCHFLHANMGDNNSWKYVTYGSQPSWKASSPSSLDGNTWAGNTWGSPAAAQWPPAPAPSSSWTSAPWTPEQWHSSSACSPSSGYSSSPPHTEDQKRREKSNEAVKRSREKTKQLEALRKAELADLKRDNEAKLQSMKAHKENAEFLKRIVDTFEVAGKGTVSEVGGRSPWGPLKAKLNEVEECWKCRLC